MGIHEHQFAGPSLRIVAPTGRRAGQRRDMRLFPVSRTGHPSAGEKPALARMLNLSDDGMVLATRLPAALGERLTLDVSESCALTGEVIWMQPGQCGLKLVAPVDSAALMQRLAEERTTIRRRRRWRPEKTVVVRSELGLQIVRLRDVSGHEAKIVHDGRFTPGMAVKLQLAPGVERPGILSWSRDGIAGIALAERIDTDQVGAVTRM